MTLIRKIFFEEKLHLSLIASSISASPLRTADAGS